MLVLCCIVSKFYKAAYNILESNLFDLDPSKTGIESKDVRLYFYYGGIIYTALKQFKKAQEFFSTVIYFPAIVTSEIMVESYKKFVLVSLIEEGSVPSLSRTSGQHFLRIIKQRYPAYDEIVISYSLRSIEDLDKCIELYFESFMKDKNYGLVKQVRQSLYKDNIAKLTKTYLTLSLKNISDVARIQDVKEVERRVLSMIRRGQVFAKINQKDGMVSFSENPTQYNGNSNLTYLDTNIYNIMKIEHDVRRMDEKISTSQQYIQKILQSERGRVPVYGGTDIFDPEHAGSGFRD